jgi:ABC-type transport system involved in multi-copper enzyme maturation permease subunit
MSATITTAPSGATIHRPSTRARLIGLGSVFGKAVRDSRSTALALGILYGVIVIVTTSQIVAEFDTPAKRALMAAQLQALPAVFQGMLGQAIGIERLGGFISWRILNFLPVMYGIWSIVALSGTLAGELSRGSLDVLASTPLVRRRLAIEKVGAYLVALAATIAILGLTTFGAATALASLPGDEVAAGTVVAHMALLFLMILAPGAAAFATAPFLGRGGAIGVGAVVLFGSFVVSSYASTVPVFEAVEGASYFHLTAAHRPLAGAWDWPSVGLLTVVVAALLVVGIEVFARRDLLVPGGGRLPLPMIRAWVRGPFSRGFGERLPAAVAWGALLGLFGVVIASSSDEFVAAIAQIPQVVQMIQRLFPDADILSTAGFLQLAFFQEGIIILGLAAAFFVGGWASDESDRRLEVVLGAPVGRAAWALRSAASVYAAIFVTIAILGGAVAAGTVAQGDDPVRPAIGVAVLGLYAMSLAGIGLAVGGLVRPSLAGPLTLVLGLGFYLYDLVGTILEWPDEILDLALTRHLGRPMIGEYDELGMVLLGAIAVGGVLLCAVGMRRRDIGR